MSFRPRPVLSHRGVPRVNVGHWPAQTLSARVTQFASDMAAPIYPVFRPRRAAARSVAPHVAGLCPAVPVSVLPDPPPAVTAIVLNRQGAQMLDDLLSSFHRINRYPNLDMIIVDHGSSDESLSVIEKWAKLLPLTIVCCRRNHSFSFSCNRAAERATGEYLLLLNNDIVLSEDMIGQMIATAARYGGIVGCKLLDADPKKGETSSVQHIGVRFKWNQRRRLSGPYDATPMAGDERIASAPSHFLAVTAAVSVCRRDDYLGVGGLCEDYLYGFEDIDLNLKLAFGWGRKNICLNNVSAFHRGRATRQTILKHHRKDWLENNFEVFSRRFGYAVRRTILPRLFMDDGSLWGYRANVTVVSGPNHEKVRTTAQALGDRYHWNIRGASGYDMTAQALLIVADPCYRLECVRHRHPMMHRIAWVTSNVEQWMRHDFSIFDLVLAGDAEIADRLAKCCATAVVPLDPAAPDAADRLFTMFIEYLSARYRIGIKNPDSGDYDVAASLASAFRLAGHFARIDKSAQWHCRDSIRDDIVILM